MELDQTYQALGDATRRAMLERLTRGAATVSELAAPLAMSLPAVMGHLKVLEAAGLVISAKQGRVRTCQVNTAKLCEAERWISERRQMWERNLDRLGQFLGEEQ